MPEGDTIHRTAAALRRALVGRRLRRVTLPRIAPPHPTTGAVVHRVDARGKHLLIHTDDGLTLHTHQRMTGSWHLYAPGERWRKPSRAARVVLAAADVTAVCFHSPVVEVLDAEGLRRHPTLRRLGPDLCDRTRDLDEAVDRAVSRLGDLAAESPTVGEVLLDQRIACGIGNIYRSEVLFLHGIAPRTDAGDLDTDTWRALLTTSARLLRANLGTTARTTVPGAPAGSLWVYGRANAACRRCAATIVSQHLGDHARVVFHCPACQPETRRAMPRPSPVPNG